MTINFAVEILEEMIGDYERISDKEATAIRTVLTELAKYEEDDEEL